MTRSMFAGIFVANEAVGEISAVIQSLARVAIFSTTKYGRYDTSKSSPPNVSIYNSVHVAIGTQIPHKQ